MLSNPQKALIKTAQRQAKLSDPDYRDVLITVTGFDTSTAPELGDRHFDRIMSYIEAIYWRSVDSGSLVPNPNLNPNRNPFRARGYWQQKNTRTENSRDRYTTNQLFGEIEQLEHQAHARGLGEPYLNAIRRKCGSDTNYRAALRKTLKTGTIPAGKGERPF